MHKTICGTYTYRGIRRGASTPEATRFLSIRYTCQLSEVDNREVQYNPRARVGDRRFLSFRGDVLTTSSAYRLLQLHVHFRLGILERPIA